MRRVRRSSRVLGGFIALTALLAAAALSLDRAVGQGTGVCENGVVITNPERKPDLVADCEALLASRDALQARVKLAGWDANTPLEDWEGIWLWTIA